MDGKFAEIAPLTGTPYPEVLRNVHGFLSPKTYLEIGTATGMSLAVAKCASIAIDPAFQLQCDIIGSKPICMTFQMSSDAFFREYNPAALLGAPVDMAFLDGMHYFEFLVRDFSNTEKYCRRNSVIFMHDCIPQDSHIGRRLSDDLSMAEHSKQPGWWAGDVWKAVMIIKKARPELRIVALDAVPTGLIAVTNLDPTSTVIDDNYFTLVAEAGPLELNKVNLDAYTEGLHLISATEFSSHDKVSARFWL